MDSPSVEQFAGCLVGQCLGDALGAPVEGRPPALCRLYVEQTLRAGKAPEARRDNVPFGQYTDDSQLARELLQSYAALGRFSPEDYARRIAAIFAEGRIFGCGRATLEAAGRLQKGVPWDRAGTPPPSAGNGSAMRAGPVGLLFSDQPEALVRAAVDQGHITHQDPRCGAGSVAIAGAVALALRKGPIDPPAFLRELQDLCRSVEPGFAQHLLDLTGWLALAPPEAVTPIAAAGADPGLQDGWQGISPFVVGSVLWSLYAFLRTPDDYFATICTAVEVGGDVDTTAAMAGAISGARLGLGGLPQDLAQQVTDQGTWGYDELLELAEDCHEHRFPPRKRGLLQRLFGR